MIVDDKTICYTGENESLIKKMKIDSNLYGATILFLIPEAFLDKFSNGFSGLPFSLLKLAPGERVQIKMGPIDNYQTLRIFIDTLSKQHFIAPDFAMQACTHIKQNLIPESLGLNDNIDCASELVTLNNTQHFFYSPCKTTSIPFSSVQAYDQSSKPKK